MTALFFCIILHLFKHIVCRELEKGGRGFYLVNNMAEKNNNTRNNNGAGGTNSSGPGPQNGKIPVNTESFVASQNIDTETLQQTIGEAAMNPYGNTEVVQGQKKTKEWGEYALGSLGVIGGETSFAQIDDYLMNTDHSSTGSIIKGYVLADNSKNTKDSSEDEVKFTNQYSDGKLSREDAINRAEKQVDDYLLSHNIVLNSDAHHANTNELRQAVATGQLGNIKLSDNMKTVLNEKINIMEQKEHYRIASNQMRKPAHIVTSASKKMYGNTEVGQGYKKQQKVVKYAVNTLSVATAAKNLHDTQKMKHSIKSTMKKNQKNEEKLRQLNFKEQVAKGGLQENKEAIAKIQKQRIRTEKKIQKNESIVKAKNQRRSDKIKVRTQKMKKVNDFNNKTIAGKTYVIAKAGGRKVVKVGGKLTRKGLSKFKKGRQLIGYTDVKRAARNLKKQARKKKRAAFIKKHSKFLNFAKSFVSVTGKIKIALILVVVGVILVVVLLGGIQQIGTLPVISITSLFPDDDGDEESMSVGQQTIEALWNRMMAYEELMQTGTNDKYSAYAYGLTTPAVYSATLNGVPIEGFSGDINSYVGSYVYNGTCTVEEEQVTYDGETIPDYTPPTVTDASTRKNIKVVFHTNIPRDPTNSEQTFYYGIKGQQFDDTGFRRDGYYLAGWALKSSDTEPKYKPYNRVIDSFILNRAPSVDLYAIWKPVETQTVEVTYTASTTGDVKVVTSDELTGDLKDRFSSNAVEINVAYIDENGQTQYVSEDGEAIPFTTNTLFKAIVSMAAVATENDDVDYDTFYGYCEKIFDMAIGGFRGYSVDYTTVNLDGTADGDYAYTWTGDDGRTYRADGARLTAKATLYVNADIGYMMSHDDTTGEWFTDNYGIENDFEGWTDDNKDWALTFFEQSDEDWTDMYDISFPGNCASMLGSEDADNYLAEIEANYGGELSEDRKWLIKTALQEVGKHYYLYGGGHTADGGAGFDCSGFVCYVLYQSGVDYNYNYRSCVALKDSYLASSHEARKPGDLLIKNGTAGGTTSSANHVAIYLGTLTIDGVTDEYTVECTTTNKGTPQEISGVQFRKYSGRKNYKYVRAID